MALLEPEVVPIDGKEFILSKFPAVAGREIITQYVPTAMPKVGDYAANANIMRKIMSYVGVRVEGRDDPLQLTTDALIDNHVSTPEMLLKLEIAMMRKNCAFFREGGVSTFFADMLQRAMSSIIPTLMDSLQQSSPKDSQASPN